MTPILQVALHLSNLRSPEHGGCRNHRSRIDWCPCAMRCPDGAHSGNFTLQHVIEGWVAILRALQLHTTIDSLMLRTLWTEVDGSVKWMMVLDGECMKTVDGESGYRENSPISTDADDDGDYFNGGDDGEEPLVIMGLGHEEVQDVIKGGIRGMLDMKAW